ncbi:unnamed protein product [Durusdinium trenchii]|uniref:Guanine nucleotide-binding protein subunit beta-like protein n=1 Tax=Durusdinium trenchii TaxID=1381693 RepID=A0ABP0S7A6_9DINO
MCVTHASRTNRRGPARINKVLIDVVIGLAITAAEDGKLRTWDVTLPELTCVGTFDKHNEAVTAVVVNFDKNRVLSGADDGSLHLWHLGRSSNASAVAVTVSDDETARVWDIQNFTSLGVLEGHQLAVRDLTVDFEEMMCVTCSDDHTLRLWDLMGRTCVAVMEGHASRVTCLRGNWKKKLVLSASDDYTLKLWDLEKQWCEETFYGHGGAVTMLC